jgi:uncharacterized membrane protein (UPF0127 family)
VTRSLFVLVVGTLMLVVGCGEDGGATQPPTVTAVHTPTPGAGPTPSPVPRATPTPTLLQTPTDPAPAIATPTPATVVTPTESPQATVGTNDQLLVRVGRGTFTVDVADDGAERATGLSGRDSLASDAGMWFAYPMAVQTSFWMRDMRFPIDIVWVDNSLKVVGVSHEAPAPAEGATISDLPLYSVGVPIRYVLEINAGLARNLGIETGTLVSLDAVGSY